MLTEFFFLFVGVGGSKKAALWAMGDVQVANRQVSYSRAASDECLFSRESEANLGQLFANHKQTFIHFADSTTRSSHSFVV